MKEKRTCQLIQQSIWINKSQENLNLKEGSKEEKTNTKDKV